MKKRIAFTFPHLYAFGGGEIFCEYLTNYLINFYNIDLYFYKSNKINKKIKFDKKINILAVRSSNIFIDYLCKNYIFIAQIYLLFFLQKKKYHFIFSGAGEFFHENKCFQYIHHPFYSLNISHYLSLGLKKKNFIKLFLRFSVSLFVRFIIFINQKKYKNTISIVNSKFIFKRFNAIYKNKILKPFIVFPTFKIPVSIKEKFYQFEKRKNDFVILGRVSEDKNTLDAVNFYLKFKEENKNLNLGTLNVIGPIEKKLKKKIQLNKLDNDDCIFHGYLSLKKRNEILKKSKFGLHFFIGEHFGRSILEMQKFGLIVFCHNSGGAMEIVANKFQKFNNLNELEKKIKFVMTNLNLRKKIKKMINKKIFEFTDRNFRNKIFKVLNNE